MNQGNNYYPVMLKLENTKCLLIGGGKVAQRKLEKLLESGASVTIISPDVTSGIEKLFNEGKIRWIVDTYKSCYLEGVWLVICATDDNSVNGEVFKDATRRGIFVNVVDDPQHCTFLIPAVLNKRDLQVAVCSGGAAPVVSVKVRNKIEEIISDDLVEAVSVLKQMRSSIKKLPSEKKRLFWKKVDEYLENKFSSIESPHQLFQSFLNNVNEN